MNFLFIAPLPPPINGHSLAARVLCEHLQLCHTVAVIDLSLSSKRNGAVTFRRLIEVLLVLRRVKAEKKYADVVYLTISESFAGNIKDLAIYLICFSKLTRFYIHLHGGSIKKLLFDKHPLLYWLNKFAIRRMGGVIVSGASHVNIFASMVAPSRVHVIPNFSQNEFFIDEKKIIDKFSRQNPLRVLFVAGMNSGKGYLHLLQAYEALDDAIRQVVRIDFAGRFDNESESATFSQRIIEYPLVAYHGVIDDEVKRSLFAAAHVFCLPTSLLEGQPISILEAYASGCLVLTTGQPGILDVFRDGVNGYEIRPKNPDSICSSIIRVLSSPEKSMIMALNNRRSAHNQYRTDIFAQRITWSMVSGLT